VPFDQRGGESLGDFERQDGLAGARLAFDEQRPLQGNCGIDRHLQIVGGDIGAGSLESHRHSCGGCVN
jgi:hypothetical protein